MTILLLFHFSATVNKKFRVNRVAFRWLLQTFYWKPEERSRRDFLTSAARRVDGEASAELCNFRLIINIPTFTCSHTSGWAIRAARCRNQSIDANILSAQWGSVGNCFHWMIYEIVGNYFASTDWILIVQLVCFPCCADQKLDVMV